jgi:hypothetical protein
MASRKIWNRVSCLQIQDSAKRTLRQASLQCVDIRESMVIEAANMLLYSMTFAGPHKRMCARRAIQILKDSESVKSFSNEELISTVIQKLRLLK